MPSKLAQAKSLRDHGCDLKVNVDSFYAANAVVKFGRAHAQVFEVWMEVDTDAHQSGLKPDCDALIAIGRALRAGGMPFGGVMTRVGASCWDLRARGCAVKSYAPNFSAYAGHANRLA